MGSSDTEAHRVAHEVSLCTNTRASLSRLLTPRQIGHILGMLHEQCRFDRDGYVVFRCDMLVGYKDALVAASTAGHADAAERLCTEQAFANQFGFEAGAQYIKNDAFHFMTAPIMDEGPFDLGSIMLYPSNAYAADPACWEKNDKNVCPLVAARFGTTWPISVNVAPSNGDVAFVKTWYKWIEEPPQPPTEQGRSTVISGHVKRVRDERQRDVVRIHCFEIKGNEMVVKHL